MINLKAFSLIELMVVIAIVAILGTVAYPALNNYLIGTRIASSSVGLSSLLVKVNNFIATHGKMPNSMELDLGINNVAGFAGQIADDAIGRDIIGPYFYPASSLQPFTGLVVTHAHGCTGSIYASLDATKLGYTSDVADNITGDTGIECDYWIYNGTFQSVCSFYYGTINTSGTGQIPGLINFNTTTGWDYTGLNAIYNSSNYTAALNANPASC